MNDDIRLKIIDTLSYFDVFNYPLTLEQLQYFLHYEIADKKVIKKFLKQIPIIECKFGYYFFSGKKRNALKRKIQEKDNIRKVSLAVRYIHFIGMIPGVKFVAMTGSVAMENASRADDIDLFIITRKNMLWTTRFMVVLLAKIFGKKREYKEKKIKDRLCFNMFLDEREMDFFDRNLYTAHEIVQMKVYFDEYRVFNDFTNENLWIQEYFPGLKVSKKSTRRKKRWFDFMFFSERLLRFVNFSAFLIQYLYMSRKITKEKVSLRKAFFHPNDNSYSILSEHRRRSRRYMEMYENSKNYSISEARKDFSGKSKILN